MSRVWNHITGFAAFMCGVVGALFVGLGAALLVIYSDHLDGRGK